VRRRTYIALATATVSGGCLGLGDDSGDARGSGDTSEQPGDDTDSGTDDRADNETGDNSGTGDGADDGRGGDRDVLVRRWEAGLDTTSVSGSTYSAATADGAVVVGSRAGLAAFDLRDGTERWHRDEWQGYTRIHADDSGVVALTRANELVAVDIGSGATSWTADVEGARADVFHPTGLTETVVLVSTPAGTTLYDRASGAVLARVGDRERSIAADGRVAVLSGPFEAVRVDPVTGERLWRTEVTTSRGGTVADGRLLAPNNVRGEGTVVAVDTGSGDRLWESPIEGFGAGLVELHAGAGVVTLRTNRVDGTDTVHTLDAADGSELWTTPLDGTVNPSHPLVAGEFVVVETAEALGAHDATTGEVVGTAPAPVLTVETVTADGWVLACGTDVTAYEL
jgi:outer membrane protein assembly factor BamB